MLTSGLQCEFFHHATVPFNEGTCVKTFSPFVSDRCVSTVTLGCWQAKYPAKYPVIKAELCEGKRAEQ